MVYDRFTHIIIVSWVSGTFPQQKSSTKPQPTALCPFVPALQQGQRSVVKRPRHAVATRLVRIQIEPEIKTLTFLPTIFGLVIMMIGDLNSIKPY